MKPQKFLLTSLLAAAAMSVPAFGANADMGNKTFSSTETVSLNNSSVAKGENYVYGNVTVDASYTGTFSFGKENYDLSISTLTLNGNLVINEKTCDLAEIGNISGTGNLTLSKNPTSSWGGALVLSGDSTGYTGTINIWNGTSGTPETDGKFGQLLVLKTATAAGSATVSLGGYTAMYVSTDSTSIGGLHSTNANSAVVSKGVEYGAARGNSGNVYNDNLTTAPTNDGTHRTLNISGSGTYEFKGTFGSATNSNKLSLSMSGSGMQTLSGTNYINNLAVSDGRLVLSGTSTVAGTTNVSGGELSLSGTLALASSAISVGDGASVTVSSTAVFVLTDALKASGTENTWTLISGNTSGITGWDTLTASNFRISGVVPSLRGASADVSDAGQVVFTAGAAANLTWKAGASGTWDVQTTQSWTNDSTRADDIFYDYDNVTFATTGDVSVSVDSGGVTAGTVNISAGTVSFSGGTITALGGLVVQNGGALNVSAALTTPSKLTVDGNATFSAAGTFSQLSGSGTIDLGSTGKLTLSDSAKFNNWTGTIKVGERSDVRGDNNNGVNSAYWNCKGATVEFSGAQGWLEGYNGGTFAANIKLVDTASGAAGFQWKDGSSKDNLIATLSGKLTGTGTFERANNGFNQSFVFSGNLSEFAGTFKHTNSKNYATLTFGGKTDAIKGTSAAEGSVTGTSTINWFQGTLNASQDKRVYFNYLNDVRSDSTITSAILVKQGAGSLTLTGTNTYTGGTTVEAGTLIAGNASALGTGPVMVNRDAKLQVKAGMNVTVSTANSTTVTIADGAKLVIDFAGVDLPAGAEERTFAIMTAAVFSIYGNTLSAGDVTNEMNVAWELLNGDEAWLDSAKWTLDGNTLSLTLTIPEPSAFGLLAGLGALALAGTRRRRRKA